MTGLAKELSRLISNVESSYPEPAVREAVRHVTMQLGEIMKLAEHVDDRLRDKVSALNFAAGQYLQTEQKILTLAQAKKEPVFKWKTSATDWMSRFNNNLWNNVTEDPGSQLSPLQILKGVLLEAKDITLESRLSSVKEDERIASLLQMLDYGSPEAQQWSREELEKIARAFEGIARSQSAYRIYDIYNNDKYKEYIHNLANRQRDILADLGVSEEWFKEGLSLSAFYKGSPLDAWEYNPLKTDFSRMPEESELRFMIAVGLFNPTYRLWSISSYDQIEAAVRKAAEQRKQLEKLLDEYNRSASTEDIRKMQQYLKDMNLYQGEVTGTYNQEFLVAVAGYQHIANSVSSVAAVRRDLFKLDAYQFEVDGKITKELLDLAAAERGLGIKNNPDLKTGGLITSITLVGVGDGVVSQLWDDTRDLVELVNGANPASIKFWTETIPAYYDFGKAVTNGDITFDEVKNIIGEAAAAEFVVPFQEIEKLSGKVFSGKATYEESQRYGRALAKAVQVVSLVTAAAKAGAKVSAKASKQISEAMSKLGDELTTPSVLTTPEGVKVPVTGTQNGGDLVVPRTPAQENFLRFQREGEVGGTGQAPKRFGEPPVKVKLKIDVATEKKAEMIRANGLDNIEEFAKNTGLSIEESKNLKSHMFLNDYELCHYDQQGLYYYKSRLTPDSEVVYAFTKAQTGELTPQGKEWFKQLAAHELAEKKLMEGGLSYRHPDSWDGTKFTNVPPGAHDLAPKQPDFGSFPGYEENVAKFYNLKWSELYD